MEKIGDYQTFINFISALLPYSNIQIDKWYKYKDILSIALQRQLILRFLDNNRYENIIFDISLKNRAGTGTSYQVNYTSIELWNGLRDNIERLQMLIEERKNIQQDERDNTLNFHEFFTRIYNLNLNPEQINRLLSYLRSMNSNNFL